MRNQSTLSSYAEKTFFKKEWETIYNLCLKKAKYWYNRPSYFEPQDLAQIAAVKVWKAIDQFDDQRSSLDSFVNVIANNAFVDACRGKENVYEYSLDETRPASALKGKVVCSVVDSEDDNDAESCPAFLMEDESRLITLELEPLLECLPARQRQVIEMSFCLGNSCWERTDESIAEELGITRQTVISDRKKALLEMQIRVGRIGVWAA